MSNPVKEFHKSANNWMMQFRQKTLRRLGTFLGASCILIELISSCEL